MDTTSPPEARRPLPAHTTVTVCWQELMAVPFVHRERHDMIAKVPIGVRHAYLAVDPENQWVAIRIGRSVVQFAVRDRNRVAHHTDRDILAHLRRQGVHIFVADDDDARAAFLCGTIVVRAAAATATVGGSGASTGAPAVAGAALEGRRLCLLLLLPRTSRYCR